MTKVALVGLASAVVGMCTAAWADPALANGKQGFHGHSHGHSHHNRLHSVPPKHFESRKSFDHKHQHHRHQGFYGRGVPWAYSIPSYVSPVPQYVPTPVYIPSPPVYAPPAYAPPVPPSVSSLPAPTETVIEFPTGRYELRGDGINTPHRWVWIPNAPDAPPSGAASAPRAAPEPVRSIEVFRWVDETGAVHLTDRLDKVPEAYRAKVTKSQS